MSQINYSNFFDVISWVLIPVLFALKQKPFSLSVFTSSTCLHSSFKQLRSLKGLTSLLASCSILCDSNLHQAFSFVFPLDTQELKNHFLSDADRFTPHGQFGTRGFTASTLESKRSEINFQNTIAGLFNIRLKL